MQHAIITQGLSACGAIVGHADDVLVYCFKDSTIVSLWDADTAAAK
jgi:hypothetical protein